MESESIGTILIAVLGILFGMVLAHHGVTLEQLYKDVKRLFGGKQ